MGTTTLRYLPTAGRNRGDVVSWSCLRERVQRYLEDQGVPAPQAERFSHAIVVLCANEGEPGSVDHLSQRAINEAETLLIGWRAARRDALLDAA
jgi:hypothetical protein